MSERIPSSSIAAAWYFILAAALWSALATIPPAALAALTIIGLAPAWVMFTLARRPEPTLARVHAVDQGRAA